MEKMGRGKKQMIGKTETRKKRGQQDRLIYWKPG